MNIPRVGASVPINGPAVRHLRTFTGLTVTGLAREVGVSPAYISRIESCKARGVSPAVFAALRTALAVTDARVIMADPHGAKAQRHLTAVVDPADAA